MNKSKVYKVGAGSRLNGRDDTNHYEILRFTQNDGVNNIILVRELFPAPGG